ncbi:uncharacterized protein BDR25DRAFT_363856 [Lindgomyces ingoldianus]|uniref:Uncharacterized protein n=1 Tax=Lindgomyces ingoldianus TaxID=673940 RepID=A0ACB6Q6N5_9PLEO|nr:uncharacterized protein BDR25DRAFT_363856 [Lindgomyces ingoldianus]KAF2462599.1 hypothetical protein BDR25DRAFT_363856 [Lindgomyces ingoldianus]
MSKLGNSNLTIVLTHVDEQSVCIDLDPTGNPDSGLPTAMTLGDRMNVIPRYEDDSSLRSRGAVNLEDSSRSKLTFIIICTTYIKPIHLSSIKLTYLAAVIEHVYTPNHFTHRRSHSEQFSHVVLHSQLHSRASGALFIINTVQADFDPLRGGIVWIFVAEPVAVRLAPRGNEAYWLKRDSIVSTLLRVNNPLPLPWRLKKPTVMIGCWSIGCWWPTMLLNYMCYNKSSLSTVPQDNPAVPRANSSNPDQSPNDHICVKPIVIQRSNPDQSPNDHICVKPIVIQRSNPDQSPNDHICVKPIVIQRYPPIQTNRQTTTSVLSPYLEYAPPIQPFLVHFAGRLDAGMEPASARPDRNNTLTPLFSNINDCSDARDRKRRHNF